MIRISCRAGRGHFHNLEHLWIVSTRASEQTITRDITPSVDLPDYLAPCAGGSDVPTKAIATPAPAI